MMSELHSRPVCIRSRLMQRTIGLKWDASPGILHVIAAILISMALVSPVAAQNTDITNVNLCNGKDGATVEVPDRRLYVAYKSERG